jgi:hypothetical protein
MNSEIIQTEKPGGAKAVAWLLAGIVIEVAGFLFFLFR